MGAKWYSKLDVWVQAEKLVCFSGLRIKRRYCLHTLVVEGNRTDSGG